MNYCKKCARILEDNSDACPYCGSSESESKESELKEPSAEGNGYEATREESGYGYEADVYRDVDSYSQSDIYPEAVEEESDLGSTTDFHDKDLNDLNDLIEENKKQTQVSPYTIEDSGNGPVRPEVIDAPEKELDPTIRIIMIVLTVLFPFVGLIVAIVFMVSASRSYKSAGKLLLIISIAELGLAILCCCGLLVLGNMSF